jgi:hypothetical protein
MSYKQITITTKQKGTPSEIAVVSRRLATPTMPPEYVLGGDWLLESSIGTGFKWEDGMLDVSAIGDVTRLYVDGSLATLNSSVGLAFASNSSIGYLRANYIPSASIGSGLNGVQVVY